MKKTILAALAGTMIGTSAFATGFSTEGVNTQGALFNDARFVAQFGYALALPRRNVEGATGTDQFGAPVAGSSSTRTSDNFVLLDVDVKARITDNIDCLGRLSQPYRAKSSVADDFVGRFDESSFEIDSRAFDATCAYKFAVGEKSRVRALAGLRAISFEAMRTNSLIAPIGLDPTTFTPVPETVNTFDLETDGTDYGYRLGASFEIPSILLRAQIIYESEIDVELEGRQTYTNVATGDPVASAAFALATGQFVTNGPLATEITLPQTLEFRLQSGINERTLLFAGVKWTDWSVLQSFDVTGSPALITGGATSLATGFEDGFTVNAGVGYALTDDVNLLGSFNFDSGIGGAFSDVYSLGAGAQFDVTDEVKVSFGGTVALLTETENSGIGGGGSPVTSSLSSSGTDFAYGVGFQLQYAID